MDLDPMDIDIDRQLEILDEIEAPEPVTATITVPAPKRRKTLMAEERVPVTEKAPTSAVSKPQSVVLNDRIPETGDYVPITFLDGRRKYLAMEKVEQKVELPITSTTRQPLVLDELSKLVESAERLLSFKRIIDTGETNGSSDTSAPVISESLWVKKYEPARYLDLISSEVCVRTF
ncbi:unnamed protein product [Dibothriocephalus latus]|uniref:Uncharacterized protein n=1 Tax=Dibothriocephalus latus TaxID=60516 RepID=A0A3P7PGU8_DIBLA|nr:unnamed protein product [Dibothriocephalus latus]